MLRQMIVPPNLPNTIAFVEWNKGTAAVLAGEF
jgi:hypothetical protein